MHPAVWRASQARICGNCPVQYLKRPSAGCDQQHRYHAEDDGRDRGLNPHPVITSPTRASSYPLARHSLVAIEHTDRDRDDQQNDLHARAPYRSAKGSARRQRLIPLRGTMRSCFGLGARAVRCPVSIIAIAPTRCGAFSTLRG
jgi:hypothetical protein